MKGRTRGLPWIAALALLMGAGGCVGEAPAPAGEAPGTEEAAQRFSASAEAASLSDTDRRRCGGIQGIPCRDGQVCIYEPGTCEVSDAFGTCERRPGGCPRVWDPVCGCDGVTYGNQCEATAAGASIDHRGECREPTCASNGDCDRAQYCAKKECGDERGECTARPQVCPLIYRPVCGCDGVTYGNRCEAAMSGANVAHEGECRQHDCATNADCASRTFYCAKDEGCDGRGVCTARPMACPDYYRPVCGCDGVTYDNECFANHAMTNVAHEGECRQAACASNGDCDRSQYCAKDACGDERGECVVRPQACPLVFRPVCGCDGVTYGNRCEAAMSGANVAHEGECRQHDCATNADCASRTFYCAKDEGCDGRGVCTARPMACPEYYRPVCGCDGNTYDNECFANHAMTNVAHEGACEVACEHTEQCPDPHTQFCRKAQCGGVGICADRPLGCPDVWDPVCACNGQTYGNACDAAADGQNVRFEGTCFCGGIAGFPCDEGEVCDPDPGQCDVSDVAGQCVDDPEFCPAIYAPVCGCDGRTYSNDCHRVSEGVAKDHDGACVETPTCCDPSEQPGTHGNPHCFEGATCCPDGEWRCNAGDGSPTCDAPWPAPSPSATDSALPASDGRVCIGCCAPESPILCLWGTPECCADGQYHCPSQPDQSACRVLGQVCEDRCDPVVCTLACEYGFANGPDGCPICECNPRPRDDEAR